jgi:uncharacterized membrane protein
LQRKELHVMPDLDIALQAIFRWFHIVAGITWIGHLYFFNFVNTPFQGGLAKELKPTVNPPLVLRALYFFRHGAMWTFLFGIALFALIYWPRGGALFDADGGMSERGMWILFGGLLGTIMWFNVWFVIWPAQQKVIASARQVSKGGQAIPEAAARGQRAGFASRTNTMLSIPMLFFMGSAMHLTVPDPTSAGQKIGAFLLLAVVMAAAEINALVGTAGAAKRILGSLTQTCWAGVVLAAILYFGLEAIFP